MDKTSISVPALQRMLGLKKGAAYWLIKQGHFEIVIVGKKMRIMLDSFEEWYASQFHYKKGDGPANTLTLFQPVTPELSSAWREADCMSF